MTEPGAGHRVYRKDWQVHLPREIVRNSELSFKARGLLALLLDLPTGWTVKAAWLEKQGKEGIEAIYSGLRELRAAGYYRIERRHLQSGKFAMGTAISDHPVQKWADEYAAELAAKGKVQAPVVEVAADGTVVDVGEIRHPDLPPVTDGDETDTSTATAEPPARSEPAVAAPREPGVRFPRGHKGDPIKGDPKRGEIDQEVSHLGNARGAARPRSRSAAELEEQNCTLHDDTGTAFLVVDGERTSTQCKHDRTRNEQSVRNRWAVTRQRPGEATG